MFVQIGKMLATPGSAMVINVVSNDDGTLTATVVPKGEWKEKALGVGLTLRGTPEELDSDLVGHIERYADARKSLAAQVEDTLAVIAAAEKESKAKAGAAIKKAVAPATPATSAIKPPAGSVAVNAGPSDVAGGDAADDKTIALF